MTEEAWYVAVATVAAVDCRKGAGLNAELPDVAAAWRASSHSVNICALDLAPKDKSKQ